MPLLTEEIDARIDELLADDLMPCDIYLTCTGIERLNDELLPGGMHICLSRYRDIPVRLTAGTVPEFFVTGMPKKEGDEVPPTNGVVKVGP